MELRSSYRPTTVGPIPADWNEVVLGDKVTKVGSGITPTGGSKVYAAWGRPFVRSQNVGWGRLLLNDIAFIDDATHASFCATELHANDVLLNITGASIGRSAVADPRLAGGNVNQHVCVIRTKIEELDPCFLNYFLLSSHGQHQIDSFQAGGNREGLNFGQVRSFRLAVPPSVDKQRAIAAALSDVDAMLAKLDQLIAKKRDLKQAAMQQLLTGRTRLRGFRCEWKDSTVGEEFNVQLGKMLDTEKNLGVAKPYVGNKAVQWGRITVDDLQTMHMSSDDLERYRLRQGDLLVCEGGEVGRAAIWEAPLEECYYQKALHRLRPRRGFNSRLMVSILHNWAQQGDLEDYVTQTSIAHLTREKFLTVPLRVPSESEQTVLSDMEAEIAALESRRNKTRALKQGMMQELLTGRIRLVQPKSGQGESHADQEARAESVAAPLAD